MLKTIIHLKADDATRKAASFAVEVQDACNSRAILASLLHHLDEMAAVNRNLFGTDLKNQHPVVIAVLDKLCSLARTQNIVGEEGDRIMAAHSACDRLWRGENVDWEVSPIR